MRRSPARGVCYFPSNADDLGHRVFERSQYIVQELAVHALRTLGRDIVKKLSDIIAVKVKLLLVGAFLNLAVRNAVVNRNQAPDLGLIELLLLVGNARHGGDWRV